MIRLPLKYAVSSIAIVFAVVILLTSILPGVSVAAAGDLICRPDYDFSIEVNGSYPQQATFYRSDERGKFLIDLPENGGGYLMDLTVRKIFAVPSEMMTKSNAGNMTIKGGVPEGASTYAFSIDGPIVQFNADSSNVRVLPVLMRPALIGPVSLEDLLADRPEYREMMKKYNPDAKSIEALRASRKPIDLEVYFATWCSHCKKYMPKILRVVTESRNPNLRIQLTGVPKMFATEPGPWQGKNIKTIPVVIVKFDGKDLTRLGTTETAAPEIELASLLQALP